MDTQDKINALFNEIARLKKTIYEGNGHNSLLVRVSQMETDITNIQNSVDLKFEKLEDSFDAKILQLEASIDNKLQKSDAKFDINTTQLNNCIENLQKELKLDYETMVEGMRSINDKINIREENTTKTKIAWIAFFSSIIATLIGAAHLWIR